MIRRLATPFMGGSQTKALLRTVGVQFGVLALNVLTGVVTARALGAEGRGIFAAVTTWPLALALLATSGIGNAAVVLSRRDPDAAGTTATAALACAVLSTVLVTLPGWAVLPYMLPRYGPDVWWTARIALASSSLAMVMHVVFKQVFAGRGAYREYNVATLLPPVLYMFALAGVLVTTAMTPDLAVAALVATAVAATLFLVPTFVRVARPSYVGLRASFARFATYAARASVGDMVTVAAGQVDRLVLVAFVPAGALGLYVVAYSFSRIVLVAQPAVTSVFLSNLASRDLRDAKELHDHGFRFMLYALLAGCVLASLVDRYLLSLVYGTGFGDASTVFRILVCEAALTCLSGVTAQLWLAADRPGVTSVVQGTSFAVVVTGLLAAVPAYGIEGAAWSMLAAAAWRVVAFLAWLPRGLDVPVPRLLPDRSDVAFIRARLG